MDNEPSIAAGTGLLRARYGDDAIPAVGPWNATLDLLLAHRSVRSYLPKPLPDGTLETIVAAAQSAATSSNLQTWSVVAVTDPDARRKLAAVAANQRHVMECPLFLVWLADISRNQRLGDAAGVTMAVMPYLETFFVAGVDAALAAQNAVVAAESLGLSTVYIGALRNDPEAVAAILGLPPGTAGVFGLCVGYANPTEMVDVKPRLPQAAVLHRERYDDSAESSLVAAYNETMTVFSERNELARTTWTDRVFGRMTKIAHLYGRDRLRQALNALGFELR
jgi:nitroreductase